MRRRKTTKKASDGRGPRNMHHWSSEAIFEGTPPSWKRTRDMSFRYPRKQSIGAFIISAPVGAFQASTTRSGNYLEKTNPRRPATIRDAANVGREAASPSSPGTKRKSREMATRTRHCQGPAVRLISILNQQQVTQQPRLVSYSLRNLLKKKDLASLNYRPT